MNTNSFVVWVMAVLFVVITYSGSKAQTYNIEKKVNFSNKKSSVIQPNKKKDTEVNRDAKSKTFKEQNGLRAASTCYNCDCQCDSYGWTDSKNNFIGNCRR